MKPNEQFKNMIAMFYQHRQTTVSNSDLIKHANQQTTFYPISKMIFRNGALQSQTEPFYDSIMIEIEKGGNNIHFISENSTTSYKKITPMEYLVIQGKGLIHWRVENAAKQVFTVVKIMAADGCVQIKFITSDEIVQTIYNVCEMPN